MSADDIDELNKFKESYNQDFKRITESVKELFTNSIKYTIPKQPEDIFIPRYNKLLKLNNLCKYNYNLEQLVKIYSFTEKELNRFKKRTKENNNIDVQDVLDEIMKLINLLKSSHKKIFQKTEEILERIKNHPYGQKKNNKKNATDYEFHIKDLFSWLFIDEWETQTKEIKGKQRKFFRDILFKVKTNFYIKIVRKRIEFDFVLIECKNYTHPCYMCIMQLLAYTILIKEYNRVKNPLCLLIFRKAPHDDFLLKIREKLFEKDKYLPILILDDDDLTDMVNAKKNNENPFNIIMLKIEDLTGVAALLNES